MTLFDQVKALYDCHLYDNLKTLTGLVLSMSDHNPELLTATQKFHVMVYQAEALYHQGQCKKAENYFKKALQMRKVIMKSKGKAASTELPSDVEVRYKIHLCYCHHNQYREATEVLETISSKNRDSKVNMALAKLYQRAGMDRSAVTCYKEVLRDCPLALEAALGLLALGVKGAEVASLMMVNNPPSGAQMDWLSSWIKAHACAASKEYTSAITAYQALDSKALFRDNVDILCSMGETQFLNGEYCQALATLQRVHVLDPFHLPKMDILSYLLKKEKKHRDLEKLSTQLMGVTENAPEPWISIGYYCMSGGKYTKSVQFAQKAYLLDKHNVEALLLKGTNLLELKKVNEAIAHFREAVRLAPHRYEAHKGLVRCYLTSYSPRESITIAGHAFRQLGAGARSYTLYASVLAMEPLNLEKAKSYLEKAMKIDPNCLEAVYTMADILKQQQQYDKGIELLRKVLRHHSKSRLHQMLGDFLAANNEPQESMDQFSIALSLDADNKKAREGLERVEKQGDVLADGSYDVECEDLDAIGNEGDSSEGESGWSDIELS